MFLALALVLTSAIGPGMQPGTVRGQVRSESTGAPLPLAVVEVLNAGDEVRAVTDSAGQYVLRGVPPGRHIVRATDLDHAPFEVEVLVPPGGQMVVDLSLALRPLTLPAVTARAHDEDVQDLAASAADLLAANTRLLEASPGVVELGLTQAAREVTTGTQPSDPSDVLYVRGGAADLKLVLLDGAPVYAPFQVGGLLEPFQSDALRSARLYLGGAPARYDGGVSYVLDLKTRSGRSDGPHAEGAVDMLSAQTMVDGPVGQVANYLVAARGVYGLGARALVSGPFPYTYGDGLARTDLSLGGGRVLRATGFFNREAVRLDESTTDPWRAYWGNSAGSLRYHASLAGAEVQLTAASGEFYASLPVGGAWPMLANGRTNRTRLAADLEESVGNADLHWGASFDRLSLDYLGWSLVHPDSLLMQEQASGNALGAYVDAAWQALKRLRLRGGFRADVFETDPWPRLEPRLSATWLVSDRSAVTLAAGEYHQYVQAAATTSSGGEAEGAPLTVARASHLVLSLDQEVAGGVRLGVEGYYKIFHGVPAYDGEPPPARASGLDLWVRRRSGRITGWLGCSLDWIWSAGGAPGYADFAERQLLSAGVQTPVIGRTHLDVRFSYGSGMPFTAVPQPQRPEPLPPVSSGPPEQELSPDVIATDPTGPSDAIVPGPSNPYLRIDARLARDFDGRYRGVAFHVMPYVRVLNALDRRDALFYQFDSGRDRQPQAVGALPLLPIVGFAWRF